MKFSTAVLIGASAALTSATGPDYDPTTGKWTCHVPDAVYCAGDSLQTNIIIRCTGLVGQPGNCNDNLAGEPPQGVQPTLCYAPELHKAACVKNCIIYGGSGNLEGTFPLPADVCTPTETTTSAEPTSTTTAEPTDTTTAEPTETTTSAEPTDTTTAEPTQPTDTTTAAPTEPTSTAEPTEPTSTAEPTEPTSTEEPPHTDEPTLPAETITITITDCATTPIPPVTTPLPPSTISTITNGTGTAGPTGGNGGGGGQNTNTPIGPSSTISPPIPGAGVANAASLGMVVLGAVLAVAV